MRTHIVQKGDTLWKIAKQYGIGFEELKRLNAHLANPDYIVPGMEIILPDGTKTQPTTKEHLTAPMKAKTIETAPKAKIVEEKVKEKVIEKVKEKVMPQPMPQPVPMPMPFPQMQPEIEVKPEFHFDIDTQWLHYPQPMQQPMPQPIFIEYTQQQPVQPVVEKEQPIPQPHIVYVPYIHHQPIPMHHPCECHRHHRPCGCHQVHRPCGCGGHQEMMHPYEQMMPYMPQDFESDYQAMPGMDVVPETEKIPEWLLSDSSSCSSSSERFEEMKHEKHGPIHHEAFQEAGVEDYYHQMHNVEQGSYSSSYPAYGYQSMPYMTPHPMHHCYPSYPYMNPYPTHFTPWNY